MARAIIVAAGMGRRLEGHIGSNPKSLVRLGEKTILERQLEALRSASVHQVTVVVGYEREKIFKCVEDAADYVFNPFFETSNSVVSLWLAKHLFDGEEDVLVMNGDVVAERSILEELLRPRHEICVAIKLGRYNELGYKARIEEDRVVEMGMEIKAAQVAGEYAGLSSVPKSQAGALVKAMDRFMAQKRFDTWYETVYVDMMEDSEVSYVDVGDRLWAEIDTREDLEQAMERWQWNR
jgi:choline kinase